MKKLIFLLLFLTLSVNAVEITGVVRKIYPQSGRVYFMLDETSSTTCHDSSSYKYYYFDIDRNAQSTDARYFEKKYKSTIFFQLLLQSAKSKSNPSNTIPVIIDISEADYPSNCGVNHIHVNYVKTY